MAAEPRFAEIRPRTHRLGHSILHVASTPSTQELARERGRAGAAEGLVVVADEQTAGQGRRGRTWTSVGSSLYATLLLRPRRPADALQLLPLVVGVAAAEAAHRLLRMDVRLKWPNDLVHEDRKMGGVLVDASYPASDVPDLVLVGLGLNGDVREDEFSPELRGSATSLSLAAGRHVCLPAYLKLFLEAFEPRYDRLLAGDKDALRAEAQARMATLGRRVRVQVENQVVEGIAVGLGPDGELLVEADGAVVPVRSGECEELRDA